MRHIYIISKMTSLVSAFNTHFMELVEDICRVFPDDVDVLSAKNSFIAVKKMNPKLLIRSWDMFVVSKYQKEIEAGDISFFINKDYGDDLADTPNSKKIIESIDRLRAPIKAMGQENQDKILKYLQNLCKLTLLCKQQGAM